MGPPERAGPPGSTHRTGQFVDRDRGTRRHQVGEHRGEMFDPLLEFEVERTVNVISGQFRVERAALSERHVQVRMLVVGQDDRDRTFDV